MAAALTQISSLATTALGIITENDVLMIFFCAGLLGVGFKVIRQAKRAAK